MENLTSIVLPVFAVIFIGFLSGRFSLLPAQTTDVLSKFVYFISFPALLFTAVAKTPIDQIYQGDFFWIWCGGMFVIYLLTVIITSLMFGEKVSIAGVRAMNNTCSNTAFIGIPLVAFAFGQSLILAAILATTSIVVIFFSLTIVLIEASNNRSVSLWGNIFQTLRSLLKNPLMLAVVLGVISIFYFPITKSVDRIGSLIGGAAVPCSLFALGTFIATQPAKAVLSGSLLPTFVKLVVHPLITYVLVLLIPIDHTWGVAAVLLAALPPAATCFVIAQKHDVIPMESSGTILLSTALSPLSIFAVLYLLGNRAF